MGKDRTHAIVVGSTCRSLAWSAARAGLKVHACDPFLDRDLVFCDSSHHPDQLSWLASRYPGALLLCAGGCEYRSTELESLCQRYQLKCLGPKPQQMSILRDRSNWRAWCESAGIHYPATYDIDSGETLQSCLSRQDIAFHLQPTWIWKPMASGGGLGIVDLDPTSPANASGIIQQKIEGQSLSTTLWADPKSGELCSLPVMASIDNQHWLGREGRGGAPYVYRGSYGPITVCREIIEQWERFGRAIHNQTSWEGWIQIDWMLDAAGKAWFLELNPRWSASMELLEAIDGESWTQRLLETTSPAISLQSRSLGDYRSWGKLVVYADRPLVIDSSLSDAWWERAWVADPMKSNSLDGQDRFWYADIPMPNTAIEAGDPVCTILARAASCQQVLQTLAKQSRLCT